MRIWQQPKGQKEAWARYDLIADKNIDDGELEDIKAIGNEDELRLNDGLADAKDITDNGVQQEHDNQHNHFGELIQDEEQHDHFGSPDQDNKLLDHIVIIDDDDDEDDDRNIIKIISDDLSSTNSNTCEFFNTNEAHQNDDDDDDPNYLSDEDGTDDQDTSARLNCMLRNLHSDLNWEKWSPVDSAYGHMVSAMMVAEHVGVRMMKEYFEIEASSATPQYGFWKGLKLFGDKGYQATKDELKVNLLGRGCIDMLLWKDKMNTLDTLCSKESWWHDMWNCFIIPW